MRHLLQLMTNKPMLMTIDAHQTYHNALLEFYKNPQLYLAENGDAERTDTFCHMAVFGPTTHRFSGLDNNCEQVTSYRDLRAEIKALVDNDDVPRIFCEFDGPGGEASGCFDLAEFIEDVAKVKPVIGFINGGSFSANYAIASACTELYASPHSLGGSIGAIRGRLELFNDKRRMTYYTSGEAKADGAPEKPLNDAESARHQGMIDELAGDFFNLVARNRQLQPEQIQALEANIFRAEKLLELGLIDGIKTEEEIKLMMTDKTHRRIVDALNLQHEGEKAALSAQIEKLQAEAKANGEKHTELLVQVDQLAQSAGVGDITAQLVAEGEDLEGAKAKIKAEAAKRDEEISLVGSLDGDDDSYDMMKLIEEA
ncbi:S49 family peptidase [Photobacterium atrarenae]|uniref:S49 family peptidase n=1 Tax=Photobacterium atrarenae TaxID=865757 RepID=A0ABY5GB38_9GAMM|nr:S49 family peptidase [Photobacterium atrarenae]UTV26390.1 S49 family peptidase [Photobacterium atrarenae]